MNLQPLYTKTDAVWNERRREELSEGLSSTALQCLAVFIEEIGNIPISDIPHSEMLPTLIEKGLVENVTEQVRQSLTERIKELSVDGAMGGT